MPDATATRGPFAPSGRVIRLIALTLLLQAAALLAASRFMIRNIRADGGTRVEFLFFAVYAVVLLLGVGTITLLVCAIVRRLRGERGERAERLAAISLTTLASTAIGADIVTFSLLGVHPYGAAMWAGVASGDVRQFAGDVLLVAFALVLLSFLTSVAFWTASARLGSHPAWSRLETLLPRRMPLYFVIGTLVFVALDQPDQERVIPREALPYYALWLGFGNRFPDARPAFAMSPAPAPPAFTRRPDIVMVLVESLRSDAMTPEVMPFLSSLAQRPGCAAGERHYAGGHLTQYGSFALLNGMAGYAFLPFMKQQRPSEPLAALRSAGYRLEAYDGTGLLGYAIAPVVPTQFDRYQTTLTRDSLVIKGMVASLSAPATSPRFVFGFLYSTHGFYRYPPSMERFPISGPGIDRITGLINRYHDAAGYVDTELARLDSVLAPRLADGSAVLVISGDHGEEFGEHGLFGHAAVGFYDGRTRVPMVICFPGARDAHLALSEHADIFPTLFDWMGAPGWDSTRLTGRSLLASSPEVVAIAGAGFPTQGAAFALVTAQHKFWLHLTAPRLDAVAIDRTTDTNDRTVPLTADVRREFDRALADYLKAQRSVLR